MRFSVHRACLPILVLALPACLLPVSYLAAQEEEPMLGKRSAIRSSEERGELVRVEAGARLRERPHPRSAILEIVRAATELSVLERRGPWVKVVYGSWQAWLVAAGEEPATGAPGVVPVEPDEERLLRARKLLGDRFEVSSLGPFILYTDVVDGDLLKRLSAVASRLAATYHRRFGLDPGAGAVETVVLFAREGDYRRFEASEPALAAAHTSGQTSSGLSVLFVSSGGGADSSQILIHELTHLLNRRLLGLEIPAWLEEGMAEDLAFSRVDERGQIQLGSLGGSAERALQDLGPAGVLHTFEASGPRGSLSGLLMAWPAPERTSLSDLVLMSWQEFVHPTTRSLNYAESAFLVRYLLDGGKASLRQGFLEYLRAVAGSAMPDGVSLWDHLDSDAARIERGLYRWLRRQAEANGLPIPVRGS